MAHALNVLLALSKNCDSALVQQAVSDRLPNAGQSFFKEQDIISSARKVQPDILILDTDCDIQQDLMRIVGLLQTEFPGLAVILIIPEQHNHHIRAAIETGVSFYLKNPLDKYELNLALNRAKDLLDYRRETKTVSQPKKDALFPGFIGKGPAMCNLFNLIRRIAEDDFSTVLIRGESGTGKELVAKAIHANSQRCQNNFVPVNCAAIPDDLLESELFGHLKGSFTGATQTKTGRIQYADQGTLFLDEIGDMKPTLQAKLLRVLQEKEFEPVGSLKPLPVDTRIVAATHCDLEELVKKGTFREDLYYRLSVVPLEVPPLRERVEDIPILLNRFIATYCKQRGREPVAFSEAAVKVLQTYEWRGNVRELENLVQHMSILHSGRTITPQLLPDKFRRHVSPQTTDNDQPDSPASQPNKILMDISHERAELFAPLPSAEPAVNLESGPISFNDLINDFETELILAAMKFTAGNKKEAARMLSLKRTTLLEKIKKKNLEGRWES